MTGAQVYTENGLRKQDVAICDGRIRLDAAAARFDRVEDLSGLVLVPGFVDVHVHLREPGFSYKETIRTGSRAAAAGGYTAVCAMPNLKPAPSDPEALSKELELIRRDAAVRVYPYGTITRDQSGRGSLPDYQTAIDMKYFNYMWKMKDEKLKKRDAEVITQTLGVNIDLLNVNWIYRSKKYFGLTPEELFNLLIPVRFKLTQENIVEMVKATDLNSFYEAEKKIRYSEKILKYRKNEKSLTNVYDKLITTIYRNESRKRPYSVAAINTYFYLKEREIRNIVTALESIHYKVPFGAKEVKP